MLYKHHQINVLYWYLTVYCGRRYIRSLPDSFLTSVKPYLERRRREFPELYLAPESELSFWRILTYLDPSSLIGCLVYI